MLTLSVTSSRFPHCSLKTFLSSILFPSKQSGCILTARPPNDRAPISHGQSSKRQFRKMTCVEADLLHALPHLSVTATPHSILPGHPRSRSTSNVATNEASSPHATLSPSFPEEHRKQTRDGKPHHILLGMFSTSTISLLYSALPSSSPHQRSIPSTRRQQTLAN